MGCITILTFNNCPLCPHCIYVFCIYLRTNSDLCHLQHKLIGFHNPYEKGLQRGTDWVFKYGGLRFVCKGLSIEFIMYKHRHTVHSTIVNCNYTKSIVTESVKIKQFINNNTY